MRKTKIVCTLGPASSDYETLKAMVEAGMDVVRLNFSHGDYLTHQNYIRTIRKVAAELKHPVAILQDLQGPKIRVGDMEEGVVLTPGEKTTITMDDVIGTAERFGSTYKGLAADVKPGAPILINDGLLKLEVEQVSGDDIHCRVIHGGPLNSHKGINLSTASISAPALTEKDLEDLEFGLSQDVDYVALSFVRQASDIQKVKDIVKRSGKMTHVIAKVERHEAVDDMEAIVATADAIMVARGDLGVEMMLEQVPMIQKSLIETCRRHQKPVITATQMLESMISAPDPTRAEATDVANSILDGTDAVMLSGETAVGQYAIAAVEVMQSIAVRTEQALPEGYHKSLSFQGGTLSVTESVAEAVCRIASEVGARGIFCNTSSGSAARLVSKYRPKTPIIAFTPEETTYHQLAFSWGVQPYLIPEVSNAEEMLTTVVKAAVEMELAEKGDKVVITSSVPIGTPGSTSLIKVHTVGEAIIL